MSDRRIRSDVLALFASPEVELGAADVSAKVVVRRPPSEWQLPEASAKEALRDLQKHGYLAVRRAKVNLYRRDPADVRPALPAGFLYEPQRTGAGVDWLGVVAPGWSARGRSRDARRRG